MKPTGRDDDNSDEIKFVVLEVKYPRKGIIPEEWDGYAIARVKLLKSSADVVTKVKGKKIIFKGSLHSLDYGIVYVVNKPILVFDAQRLCYNLMVNKYKGRLTFECAKLGESVLLNLLCLISDRCSPKQLYHARSKQQWSHVLHRKKKRGFLSGKRLDLQTIQEYVLPEVSPLDWLLCDYCHLWRLKELLPCVPSDKVMRCKTIAPSKITALKRVFNTTPWLLCLPHYMEREYSLKPFTLKDVNSIISAEDTPCKTKDIWQRAPISTNYLREATRLMDDLRKRRKQTKDTLMNVPTQYTHSPIYNQICSYLTRRGEVTFIERTRVVIAKDKRRAQSLHTEIKKMVSAPHRKTIALERYARGKGFTSCQMRAINIIQGSAFSVITGKPGTGKTHTIGCLTQYAETTQDIKVLVVSFIGRMVNSLRKRLKNSEFHQLQHSLVCEGNAYSVQQQVIIGTINGALEHVDEGAHFDVLVIDEAANIGISLMLRLLKRFSVSRLVLVMDPDQVPPISYGWPAVDLMKMYPSSHVQLKQNMRLDPSSLYIADMYDQVLGGMFDSGVGQNNVWFSSQSFKLVRSDDNASPLVTPGSNKRKLGIALPLLNEDLLCSKLEYILFHCLECTAEDFSSWQFLCFTRRVVALINSAVIRLLKQKRVLSSYDVADSVFIRDGFSLFPGQKFTSSVNVKARKVSSSNELVSSSIQNGEIQVVSEVDTQGNKHWVKCRSGKAFLLDKAFLDKENVVPAYATTVNKYQGSECNNIVLVAIPGCENLEFIDRRHVYVAVSRARKRFIALSTPKYFYDLSRIPLKKKHTFLSQLK